MVPDADAELMTTMRLANVRGRDGAGACSPLQSTFSAPFSALSGVDSMMSNRRDGASHRLRKRGIQPVPRRRQGVADQRQEDRPVSAVTLLQPLLVER